MIVHEVKVTATSELNPRPLRGHWDQTQPLDGLQEIVTLIQEFIDRERAAAVDPTKASLPIPTNGDT